MFLSSRHTGRDQRLVSFPDPPPKRKGGSGNETVEGGSGDKTNQRQEFGILEVIRCGRWQARERDHYSLAGCYKQVTFLHYTQVPYTGSVGQLLPPSALLPGLAMKALRGKPGSPGMSKLLTASVARDF